jgi:hypothetical protein
VQTNDLLLDAFGRIEGNMRLYLGGLTAAQLVYRPNVHANSIGWLAWHLTRVQDDHVADLAGRPQAWIADGWHARFDRPANPGDTGFGHTPEQVARIRLASTQLLLDYYAAVHQHSLEFVRRVTPAELDRVLDEPQWDPPVTVGVRLVSVIEDCSQHLGQMAYVRGLIENKRWLPY